ncbi:MAG TPA: alpha/beta hydrolase, partial [Burkholderiales bacterium]|nr:alpha/beta hydrolase [Burkholderiales bacterium]
MKRWLASLLLCSAAPGISAADPQTVEIPTRPAVTQRFVLIEPAQPKAAVILLAGSDGWINIESNGRIKRQRNFLVRSRNLFAEHDLMVAVVDAPSDRQSQPYLQNFRQTPEHVVDIKAVITWLKQKANVPVWLVGTSRGTQSAAYIATQLAPSDGGPDGLVLTSTILADRKEWPVPKMALERLRIPTLVVHHKKDGCGNCKFSDISRLT